MNIIDKIRELPPVGRHFASAAIGVGAFGVGLALNFPYMGWVVGLGGSFLTNMYSDPTRGNIGGYSTDGLKNFGSLIGGYFLAPYLLGAVLSAAHADEIDVGQNASPTPVVQQVEQAAPATAPVLKL